MAIIYGGLIAAALILPAPEGLWAALAFFALTFVGLCILVADYINTRGLLLRQKRLWIYLDTDEHDAASKNNEVIARLWRQKPSSLSPLGIAAFLLISMAVIAMHVSAIYGELNISPPVTQFITERLQWDTTSIAAWLIAIGAEVLHILNVFDATAPALRETTTAGLVAGGPWGDPLIAINRFIIGVILIGGVRRAFSFIEQDKRLAMNAAEFGVYHHALVLGPGLFRAIANRVETLSDPVKNAYANRNAAVANLALLVGFMAGRSTSLLFGHRRRVRARRLLMELYRGPGETAYVRKWAVVGLSFVADARVIALIRVAKNDPSLTVQKAADEALTRIGALAAKRRR